MDTFVVIHCNYRASCIGVWLLLESICFTFGAYTKSGESGINWGMDFWHTCEVYFICVENWKVSKVFLTRQSISKFLYSILIVNIYGPIERKLYHGMFPKSIFQSTSTAQNDLNIVSLYLWLYEKPRRPRKFLFSFCQN